MKLGIVGSRSLSSNKIRQYVFDLLDKKRSELECIVSGGAKGPDSFAYEWTYQRGGKFILYRPDYEKHGKGATFIRNSLIVKDSDVIVAFYDGKSRGTMDSIKKARKSGKKLVILTFSPETSEFVSREKYNF